MTDTRARSSSPKQVEPATFVASAVCAWSDQWLAAQQNGDAGTVASSASEIEGALQWPVTKAAYADTLPINWLPAAQQSVQADDVDTVDSMFHWLRRGGTATQGGCAIYAPPSDSDNGTVYQQPSS